MGVRDIKVAVAGGGTGSLKRDLNGAAAEVTNFRRRVESEAGSIARAFGVTNGPLRGLLNLSGLASRSFAGLATGVAAAGIAVTVALTGSAVAAAQFDQNMRNVNSISGLAADQFARLSKEVVDLSKTMPQSANTLAKGLYDIASSGFQGADGLKVLKAAGIDASAGLTDTASSAKAITAVLNAYGLSADHATDVSDTLFQTVNLGVLDFQELTGVIGDVAGSAAAAGVGIDQVGAAIATITLTGVSGAEAGTALAQVIRSLVQPSEALAATYKRLGVASGETLLRQEGLRGALETIAGASGRSLTAISGLIPDIRAAKGAVALLGNEGKRYADVSAQIESTSARAGAAQRAFAEQSKGAVFQFQVLKNQAQAAAIELGLHLLPALNDGLRGLQHLTQNGISLASGGFDHLRPLIEATAHAGANLITVLDGVAHALAPVAGLFAQLAAGALLGTLNAIAHVLEAVTHVLAANSGAVTFLAQVYLATLLVSVLRNVAAQTAMLARVGLVTIALANQGRAAAASATGWKALSLSMLATTRAGVASVAALAAANAPLIALGTALAVATREYTAFSRARDQAGKEQDPKVNAVNALDPNAVNKAINDFDAIAAAADHANKVAFGPHPAAIPFTIGIDMATDNEFLTNTERRNQAWENSIKLATEFRNGLESLERVAITTGVSVDQLRFLAEDHGLADALTHAFDSPEAVKARQQLYEDVQNITAATGQAGDDMRVTSEAQARAIEIVAERVKAAVDAATKATRSGLAGQNVLANFTPDASKGAKSVDAQLRATFAATLKSSQAFYRDYQRALANGLDPKSALQLLERGPAQAGAIFEALAGKHGRALARVVNSTQSAINRGNAIAIRDAQLTATAIARGDLRSAKDLADGIALVNLTMQRNAPKGPQALADALHLSLPRVKGLALEWGIDIGKSVQRGLDAHRPVVPYPKFPSIPFAYNPYQGASKNPNNRAGGGQMFGPGGPTDDLIPAMLSNREWVHPVAAVDYYGTAIMRAIQHRTIPKSVFGYAGGGQVGQRPNPPTVVRVTAGRTAPWIDASGWQLSAATPRAAARDALTMLRTKAWAAGWDPT